MAMTNDKSLRQIFEERVEGNTMTLDSTQSITVPIGEEPDMTTVMSENVPESSLPTTVPVETLTWMENDDTSCSSISSNSTVDDTLAKVNTQIKIEGLWTSHLIEENKNQYQQKLNDITHKLSTLLKQNKQELGEQFKQKELELHHKFEEEKLKLQQKFEKKNRELEHERALKAQLSKELKGVKREKREYYLRSTENEKKVRELTQKMNELSVTNERLRGTKLKRNIIRENYNNSKHTVDQLNMFVITCSVNNGITKYYAFRRKLKGLLHAVNKKSCGEHVKFWYVSSNAVKDFDDNTDSYPIKVKQLNKFVKEQSDEMFKDIYDHIMEDLIRKRQKTIT
ncbi:Uncharacterized protein FWK35_00014233 [Aphis craccivora]|uniref:Uncharacterized protein n=1 Tax=Aphis craccivora TaxID=307492 RepID=A0A6G0YJU6_APHCR|nr:Uncharacterized protein FWK35_00014233 [Aphis craccivora]